MLVLIDPCGHDRVLILTDPIVTLVLVHDFNQLLHVYVPGQVADVQFLLALGAVFLRVQCVFIVTVASVRLGPVELRLDE